MITARAQQLHQLPHSMTWSARLYSDTSIDDTVPSYVEAPEAAIHNTNLAPLWTFVKADDNAPKVAIPPSATGGPQNILDDFQGAASCRDDSVTSTVATRVEDASTRAGERREVWVSFGTFCSGRKILYISTRHVEDTEHVPVPLANLAINSNR